MQPSRGAPWPNGCRWLRNWWGVEFNPETVRKYRLLGYENRAKADDSFRDDTEDFGEIGFRSDVTALYEVRPLGELRRAAWRPPGFVTAMFCSP